MERPSPRLPGELTDEIIAWIPDLGVKHPLEYYPTLLSCCLVCSQWLPASRHQLFPHLYIASAQSYDLFVSQVLPQHSMRVYLSRVRALTLTNPVRELERGRSSIPFSYAFVGHLPNLTALYVDRGGVMTYSHPPLLETPPVLETTASTGRRCPPNFTEKYTNYPHSKATHRNIVPGREECMIVLLFYFVMS